MVFYVFQGETYKIEREGKYVWSPQKNKSGGRNIGYTTMTEVHKGDFILHNASGKVAAISIALNDCYDAPQPVELEKANTSVIWNHDGFRIDCKYIDFNVPLYTSPLTQWLADHYVEGSAFTSVGRGKQQYMCHLADDHALYILRKAIELQSDDVLIKALNDAIIDIIGEKDSEYDPSETDIINDLVDDHADDDIPDWTVGKEEQEMTVSSATGRPIPKRNPQKAANALAHAYYQCEYNQQDRLFKRKNGKYYTEPHHLIPISRYRDFDCSVDVMENIVSLCSHCHNLLHYGRMEDKKPILTRLYNDRREALHNKGLDLSLEQLLGYYK